MILLILTLKLHIFRKYAFLFTFYILKTKHKRLCLITLSPKSLRDLNNGFEEREAADRAGVGLKGSDFIFGIFDGLEETPGCTDVRATMSQLL